MKTYTLDEAHAIFSKLVERALAGEPQHITRHGKEAVVIVSERDWNARSRSAPSLGALLARYATAGKLGSLGDAITFSIVSGFMIVLRLPRLVRAAVEKTRAHT